MPSYEMNRPLKGIEEIQSAFQRKTGDKYTYIISKSRIGSRISRLFSVHSDRLLVRQNAYHGVEIYFQEQNGRQFLSTAVITPNAFLASVLGRIGILDALLARTLFGTKKQLVTDVNDVIVNSFPVTILDAGWTSAMEHRPN